MGAFREGDRIEARFRGREKYYPGGILTDRGDGTYDVRYDDGTTETHVREDLIRKGSGTVVVQGTFVESAAYRDALATREEYSEPIVATGSSTGAARRGIADAVHHRIEYWRGDGTTISVSLDDRVVDVFAIDAAKFAAVNEAAAKVHIWGGGCGRNREGRRRIGRGYGSCAARSLGLRT